MVDKVKNNKQILKFGIVGVLNTLVDMATFAVLSYFGIFLLFAQTIAYSCGVLNSYIFNKNWTFKDNKDKEKKNVTEFVKFASINLITWGVSLLLLTIFVEYIDFSEMVSKIGCAYFNNVVSNMGDTYFNKMVSKILITGIIQFLNFFGYKFLVFKFSKNELE